MAFRRRQDAPERQPLTARAYGKQITPEDIQALPVPAERRRVHDVTFCILFAAYWAGMLALGFFAVKGAGGLTGYHRLVHGVQYDGSICGLDPSVVNSPYIYWPSPMTNPLFGVCVPRCPTTNTMPQVCVSLPASSGSGSAAADAELDAGIEVTFEEDAADAADLLGSGSAGTGSQHTGSGSQHTGSGSQHTGSGSQHTGSGSQHTGSGSQHTGSGSKHSGSGSKHSGSGSQHTGSGSKHSGSGSHGGNGVSTCYTTYNTTVLAHYCFPAEGSNDELVDAVEDLVTSSDAAKLVADLGTVWPALLAAAVIAMVLGYAYLYLLWRYGAGLVYTAIVLVFLGALGGGIGMWVKGHQQTEGSSSRGILTFMALALWGFDVLFIFLVIFMRKSIATAVACLQEAANAIRSMKKLLVLPAIKFVLMVLVFVWFILIGVFLVSSGHVAPQQITVPGTTSLKVEYKGVEWNNTLRWLFTFHLFGTVWTVCFLLAMADIIVAGAIAKWYFTAPQNGTRSVDNPLRNAVRVAVLRQMGSAALGSFLLAIVAMIKYAMEIASRRFSNKHVEDSKFVQFVVGCCTCFVNCFECCVKFIDRQAYIHMALFDASFWESAKAAFGLLLRNSGKFAAVTTIGRLFSWLGIFVVTLATVLCTFFIVEAGYSTKITSPAFPLLCAVLIGYAVSALSAQVLDMGMNTILHCFVADNEAHGEKGPRYIEQSSAVVRVMRKGPTTK